LIKKRLSYPSKKTITITSWVLLVTYIREKTLPTLHQIGLLSASIYINKCKGIDIHLWRYTTMWISTLIGLLN